MTDPFITRGKKLTVGDDEYHGYTCRRADHMRPHRPGPAPARRCPPGCSGELVPAKRFVKVPCGACGKGLFVEKRAGRPADVQHTGDVSHVPAPFATED